jgi:hypothetical protein
MSVDPFKPSVAGPFFVVPTDATTSVAVPCSCDEPGVVPIENTELFFTPLTGACGLQSPAQNNQLGLPPPTGNLALKTLAPPVERGPMLDEGMARRVGSTAHKTLMDRKWPRSIHL